MELKIILSILTFASIVGFSSPSCSIKEEDEEQCNYEVICSKYTSGVVNPECEDEEPSVHLTIKDSNQVVLSKRFFASTNFDARVKEIKAINNRWNKISSYTFRYYINCDSIDLSDNKIEEIDNLSFGAVFRLKHLNLSNNVIKIVNSQSFYISEDSSYGIEVLDLSNNNLTELSSQLKYGHSLRELYLQNNKLMTISDDAFISVINLNYLNLQHNYLTALNMTMSNLRKLTILDLSWNNLTEINFYDISRLVGIVNFNVSHNSITVVDNNSFKQAVSLKIVDFSFNKINMSITQTMFASNKKLEYLNFYNNCITGIDNNSFESNQLDYLNLENNCIHGDIQGNMFIGMSHLKALNLSQQHITGIKGIPFGTMNNLLYLNLSRNYIQLVENSSFSNTFITILDLSYNNIEDVTFLRYGLIKVVELYLNNNNITEIPTNSFVNQTEIKILDLSMNNIIRIEAYSLPLQNLQYFYITGNKLNGVIKKNTFSPAKYLRFLNLNNLNITNIEDSAFTGLPGLARLNLSNNQIDSIAENNFDGVDNMFSLDLSYNNLSELKLNSSSILRKLNALYLNNNKLADITDLFLSKCKISYLELSNNNLKDNFVIGSDILPNITVLRLTNNQIKQFNNPKTNSLTTLIDLVLSSNVISEIELGFYKELMTLDLSNNSLKYINFTLLEENIYLQALDVSKNKITEIPPGTFKNMKNLKLLNVSGNYIETLRYGSLKGLHKTEVLDLSRNIITDLDIELFHECTDLKTLIIDYNRIKVFDVHRLIYVSVRNLKKLSLGGNPISCKVIFDNVKYENVSYYTSKSVEVTSMDKVYHEDNVHGIQCGDKAILNVTTVPPVSVTTLPSSAESSLSPMTIGLIWCLVLSVVLVGIGTLVYFKVLRKRVMIVNRPLRSSINLSASEFGADLLG